MAPRLDLQNLFLVLLELPNVYFQPPPTVKLEYPAIIYKRDDRFVAHADNAPYKSRTRYEVTYIDEDPDSPMLEKIAALPLCAFDRHFKADNLNHDVFNLYF